MVEKIKNIKKNERTNERKKKMEMDENILTSIPPPPIPSIPITTTTMPIIEYDLNNICRSCLHQSDNLKSIFDVIGYNNIQPINEIIMACAQVQVCCLFFAFFV